jgi:hypothetical protein
MDTHKISEDNKNSKKKWNFLEKKVNTKKNTKKIKKLGNMMLKYINIY